MNKDKSTEYKIKEAARKLFQEKGYKATRTREIAESAGINSALLNYYFRSKEKLFHIIILESIHNMFAFLYEIINNKETSLTYKIEAIVDGYIDVIIDNPNLALFVLNEIHTDTNKIIKESGIPNKMFANSYLYQQLETHIEKESIKTVSPLHIIMNIISMAVMPVIARPLVIYLNDMKDKDLIDYIEELRKLIPIWIKNMLKLEE